VDGFPVHAVIVDRQTIRHDSTATGDRRVDGRAVHPTSAVSAEKKTSPALLAARAFNEGF